MDEIRELKPDELYRQTDPDLFSFETTAELDDLDQVLGQPRAIEAMEFGLGIEARGYNIFALGPAGTGKRTVVRQYFERRAGEKPVPPDWCYVNNFDETHKPKAIRLPPGMAVGLRQDMNRLIESLSTALSAAFESEEYQARRQSIAGEFQEKQSEAFQELQEEAKSRGVALLRTPSGLAFAPMRDGEVLPSEEIQELSQEEREKLEAEVEELQEDLQKIVRQVPGWQRQVQEKLRDLNREMAEFAVGGLIDELREKYNDHAEVVAHLDAVQKDIVENAQKLTSPSEEEGGLAAMLTGAAGGQGFEPGSPLLRRYRINVLVDHSDAQGAPVIFEDNPTYQNLVGRVEHRAQMGALITDFNLIKPGALHRANGGYLILDARKVLLQPYAWESLKRALQSGEVRIESVGQMLSLMSTVSLQPGTIPLDVKVALFGEPMIYYLLYHSDPDFPELFKVQADFARQMERNDENQELYARLLATLARREELLPLDRSGVARVIEQSARFLGDSHKLSAQMRDVADLLRQADYWAGQRGSETITASHVQQAIDAQIYRSDQMRERAQEGIERGIVLIETRGEKVGQINGLSVLQLGNFSFGRPSRITARAWMGKGNVVDIEREVELAGPIHSKGVLILSGFLGERYAEEIPLSLSASLVFEQSYSGVEGDSASSAELYALLSAIAEVPLKQSLAVTGSVNQHGLVQAIGGVNQKIEGFFDVCRQQGLTGEQGVLIPASNVQHLMLRQDVVDAVEEGQFHVYPVENVNQGIELLTGMPAGERDAEGQFAEGTFNYRVERTLKTMAEQRQTWQAREGEEKA
ncbi:MAG: ATP-binding protein [Anaerolineae bacterium]|jgi:lon-related putative ATP-dependent protease